MSKYSTDVPPSSSVSYGAVLSEELEDIDLPFYTYDSTLLHALEELAVGDLDQYGESFQCPVCFTTNDYPGPCSRECYVVWNAPPDTEELFYDMGY